MSCYQEGTLRGYLDRELERSQMASVQAHLGTCATCRRVSEDLAAVAGEAAAALATVAPAPSVSTALRQVRERFESRRSLGRSALVHRNRLAFSGLAAAVVVALLALTPVRMVASDLLSVFRVQKFAAVTIDPSQLPILPDPGKTGDVTLLGQAGVREVTIAEATQNVDFPIRQATNAPAELGQPRVFLSNPVEVSYKFDLASLKAYLAKAGAQDVQLPTALDGATLRGRMPASVALAYGMNASGGLTQPPGRYLVIGESRGPTVELPDNVDADLLRNQVLSLPILPPELAAQLRAIKDWRSTMVIPVRPGTQRDVTVAGVPGLLIDHRDQGYTLLWQKDGVLYMVAGNLPEGDVMRIANGLR